MTNRPRPIETITYDNFGGGERGSLQDWRSEPTNSFRALNMLVYKTGELGVRPGLLNETPSGVSTGLVRGFGTTPVVGCERWFVVGSTVYVFQSGGTHLQSAATTITSQPTEPVQYVEIGSSIYFITTNAGLYQLSPTSNVVAPTVTKLTAAPSAVAISVYEDRLVLGNITGSNANRIRFSDALDYTSWPAANFFDVGDNYGIGGLWWQRGHLLIGKATGFYAMTGVPGYNAALRKVLSTHNGPVRQYDGALVWQDNLVYHGLGMQSPAMFNGSVPKYFTHLNNAGFTADSGSGPTPSAYGITPLRAQDTGFVFLTQGNKAIAFVNGVWTFHTFGVNISPYSSVQGIDNIMCLTDGGGASATAKFYTWSPTQDSPGIEGQSFQRAGDDSSTPVVGSVTFPEWHSPWGGEVIVKDVIVDFRKWNTGSSTNNHFDVNVTTLRTRPGVGSQVSQTLSFDEATSSSSASGTLDRFTGGFGETGQGNGFQISLSNVKGIAIQRIQVVIEYSSFRGPTAHM